MIIIAHRGNTEGPESCNHDLDKINQAMDEGFYVELDLWCINDIYYLGHDKPEQAINLKDFDRPEVFFHLKNLFVPNLYYADAFAINQDDFALTLRGRIWCNYNMGLTANSIACSPELVGASEPLEQFLQRYKQAYGICTDYAKKAVNLLN